MNVLVPAALACASAIALGACSTPPQRGAGYDQEYETLRRDCEARGGSLIPSARRLTGQPQIDNICRIRNATNLDPRP